MEDRGLSAAGIGRDNVELLPPLRGRLDLVHKQSRGDCGRPRDTIEDGFVNGCADAPAGKCDILRRMTTMTLQAAVRKAAELPKEAQDEIAREVFERVDGITRLRAALEIGIRELDAGLGEPLDLQATLRRLHNNDGTSH